VIVLAVLLLLLAAVLTLFVSVGGATSDVDVTWGSLNLQWDTTALTVFLLGASCLLMAEVGVVLLRRGTQRKLRQRREVHRLRESAGAHEEPASADEPEPTPTETGTAGDDAESPRADRPGTRPYEGG
jgi:hypothetical protein